MALDPTTAADIGAQTACRTIVCGLDGSPQSAEMARIAGEAATAIDAEIEFVHVLEGGPWEEGDPAARAARQRAQAMLDGLRDACGRSAGRAHLMTFGETPYWIASAARSARAEMIVVAGSRAASRLGIAAPCPVLVVPAALTAHVHPDQWHGRAFVCGYDGSAPAWNAALHAGRLASCFGSPLELVAVGPGAPDMAGAAARVHARLAADGVELRGVGWKVLCGDPAYELEHAARALTAPVLTVGSHGAGSREPILGSVAWQLLIAAKRAVMVVPAASARHG